MSSVPKTIMKTAEDVRRSLTERASMDPEFRTRVMADPKGVVREEFGIELPDEVSIQVHECDANTYHLALPSAAELTEEQLEQVSAGLCCCGI